MRSMKEIAAWWAARGYTANPKSEARSAKSRSAKRGRKTIYPLANLIVGASFKAPLGKVRSVRTVASRTGKQLGFQFSVQSLSDHVVVTRIE